MSKRKKTTNINDTVVVQQPPPQTQENRAGTKRNVKRNQLENGNANTSLIVRLGGSDSKGLSHEQFIKSLEQKGLSRYSAKFEPTKQALSKLPDPLRENEVEFLITQDVFVSRAIDGDLVIKDFAKFIRILEETYTAVEDKNEGELANYIPELASVDPNLYGVSACSIDAQQWKKGDADVFFCLQSISMTVAYLLALEENGEEYVHSHVGCEPSGAEFNARILNKENLPHNPYVNCGAIMCCSMIQPKKTLADRFDYVMETWSRFTGGARPTFANATYLSERATADRNFSLAYMMNEVKVFPEGTNLLETLQFYFMLCSIEVTSDMLSVAAGTLASGGVCPVTGERVFSEKNVKNCLSLMASCGMFDFSGEFMFNIGFPAKSGVAGGLLLVIPGITGLCIYSPRLDRHGNSSRGIAFCLQLVSHIQNYDISLHINSTAAENYAKMTQNVKTEILFAVSRNDLPRVRVCVACDPSCVNCADYDSRTPLHIAASFGYTELCKYLLAHGAKLDAKDFLNNTPADDAKRLKFKQVSKIFAAEAKKVYAVKYGSHERDDLCLFAALDDNALGGVAKQILLSVLKKAGFAKCSYWEPLYAAIDAQKDPLCIETFSELTKNFPVIRRCICGHITIAEWEKFTSVLQKAFLNAEKNKGGKVVSFPPGLSKVDADAWEMSFCSTTAQIFNCNKSQKFWAVQSMTHVINYIIAQELLGEDHVHNYVGKEPSIRTSEFSLNARNRPHNPAINAGALVVVSMIKPELSTEERFEFIRAQWAKLGLGNRECVRFDNDLFTSELNTVTRKWTLAFMLLERGVFPPHIKTQQDLKRTVELYLMTLSLLASTELIAVFGAVLANEGVCPFTNERLLQRKSVRNALAIMNSCGLGDGSGEFLFRVGIPALSGRGGGTLAVIPNLGAFCTYSPRLGNNEISVRAVEFYCEVTNSFNFHAYDTLVRNKTDPTVFGGNWNDERVCNLLHAAGKNDLIEVKKELSFIDVNSVDYDNRTALHVASAADNKGIVRYLVSQNADVNIKDRWDHIPVDYTTSKKLKMILGGEIVPEKQKSRFLKRRRLKSSGQKKENNK